MPILARELHYKESIGRFPETKCGRLFQDSADLSASPVKASEPQSTNLFEKLRGTELCT